MTAHRENAATYLQKIQAVSLVAAGVPRYRVAEQLGVPRDKVAKWLREPEQVEQLALVRSGVKESTRGIVAADKTRRIAYAQIVINKLLAVIEARAATARGDFPGEETGLLAVKPTQWGLVAHVDRAVLAELREWLTYTSKELGEWTENVRVAGQVEHVHRRPDLTALSDEELESLSALADRVYGG